MVYAWAIGIGIVMGIYVDRHEMNPFKVEEVKAVTVVQPEAKEVKIEVVYNWTPERIEKEIRDTFKEAPNTAVAVAKCESGLNPKAVGPTQDYGLLQVHGPSWDALAKKRGLTKYKTDVKENLAMARIIYEDAGKSFSPWVCYTKKMY